MSFRSRCLVWSVLAAAYWSLIFILTHIPIHVPGAEHSLDKLQHLAAFFGLAVLLCAAVDAWRGLSVLGCAAILLLAATYGALDELTQALVPNRYPSVLDWFADAAGATLGVCFGFGWVAFWRARAAASSAVASAEVNTR
jgi:VanZ family protein